MNIAFSAINNPNLEAQDYLDGMERKERKYILYSSFSIQNRRLNFR